MIERITSGRTDLVADHIAAGGAATAQDANGVSLLQWCAYYGDVAAMRVLLAHGASLAVLGADLGLNAAAFHGHWRLCQFLIEHGADANAAMPDTGETPLHSALAAAGTRLAHDLVVEVLLAAGADPNRPVERDEDAGFDLLGQLVLERGGQSIGFVPRVAEHVGEEAVAGLRDVQLWIAVT